MKYLIIPEPTETGYSAYSPDLDGWVAAWDDRDDTRALMQEAISSTWRACPQEATRSRPRGVSPSSSRSPVQALQQMCHATDAPLRLHADFVK
jgi:predicted RNase H-like HicB family nuclease